MSYFTSSELFKCLVHVRNSRLQFFQLIRKHIDLKVFILVWNSWNTSKDALFRVAKLKAMASHHRSYAYGLLCDTDYCTYIGRKKGLSSTLKVKIFLVLLSGCGAGSSPNGANPMLFRIFAVVMARSNDWSGSRGGMYGKPHSRRRSLINCASFPWNVPKM